MKIWALFRVPAQSQALEFIETSNMCIDIVRTCVNLKIFLVNEALIMAKPLKKAESKDSNINIRASRQEKDILSRAAKLRRTTVTGFVLEKAIQAAQEVLAEQTSFILSDEDWHRFCEALDAPAKDLPQLRDLLGSKTVLDV
jgi:uncharacterized protein (DUF1778 family)